MCKCQFISFSSINTPITFKYKIEELELELETNVKGFEYIFLTIQTTIAMKMKKVTPKIRDFCYFRL